MLGLLITVLVKLNHLEDKVAMAVPIMASTTTAVGTELAAQQQQSPHGVRNALLRHNIAGLKNGAEKRAANVARDQEQPVAHDADADGDSVPDQVDPTKPAHELSLAERIARAKQMVNRQRNVQELAAHKH